MGGVRPNPKDAATSGLYSHIGKTTSNGQKVISVVMASYNGQSFVVQQLRSISDQLSESDEIIVVDDRSTDATVALVSSLQIPNLKVISNETNQGVVASFARGADLATGDVIFFSDQDDVWLPNKVSIVLQDLQDFDLVCHNATIVDENLSKINSQSYFEIRSSSAGITKNFFKNSYVGCCMAMTRELYENCKYGLLSAPMHDVHFGIMSEILGYRINFNSSELILWRRHGSNVTEVTKVHTISNLWGVVVQRSALLRAILVSLCGNLKARFLPIR